jgi:hypothetical protein
MNRADLIRHLFGPAFRLYSPPCEAEEVEATVIPTGQEVAAALFKAGCSAVVSWNEVRITGRCAGGEPIAASRSHAGWLLTGGPRSLLSYGVRDAGSLERFPEVLASVRAHAEALDGMR